jgi:hypothetical protein
MRLSLTNDEAYRLLMRVAAGELSEVGDIAGVLQNGTGPRTQPAPLGARCLEE